MTTSIEKNLRIVFFIAISVFVFEIVGGILSNSLALVADSFHVLLDFSAIGISLIAFRIANRPHSSKFTFGFHRVEIVAALVNGISLLIVSAFIAIEAYKRFFDPPEIDVLILAGVAAIGLVANIAMAIMLKKESKSNLNVHGSYLHVLGDLISSIGVIVGAVIIFVSNYFIVDTIVSVAIAIMIARSGIVLCRKCLHIFMEGTPVEVKVTEISKELVKLDEIIEVHDLHVWTLTSNLYAMSVHVKIKSEFVRQTNGLLKKINHLMREKFGITHCTIQIEDDQDLINPKK